jgi:UPF0271 protein
LVLDTSAFVAGFDPFSVKERQYTIPEVNEELLGNSMLSFRFRTAAENGRIRVQAPAGQYVDRVKAASAQVGDKFFLSETDTRVLALALQLKNEGLSPLIATDDYSIQNVANQLSLEFASLATFGITRRLHWIRYCPACHRTYPADYKSNVCEVCGTRLKRKPTRKTHISRT